MKNPMKRNGSMAIYPRSRCLQFSRLVEIVRTSRYAAAERHRKSSTVAQNEAIGSVEFKSKIKAVNIAYWYSRDLPTSMDSWFRKFRKSLSPPSLRQRDRTAVPPRHKSLQICHHVIAGVL